ncbi:MAG: type II toxin-antitoxin system VapC family toxin [Gallionellaceae bacterium]
MRYVVDTNVFNRLVDGRTDIATLPSDAELVATHIQIDEINRTTDTERRAQLFLKFAKIAPAILPTESGVWGTSRWGESKCSNGQRLNSIISALDQKRKKPNNKEDALIAEVAMANGYGLITADCDLSEVMKERNVSVIFVGP